METGVVSRRKRNVFLTEIDAGTHRSIMKGWSTTSVYIGLVKMLIRVFHMMVQKNSNIIFGQSNIYLPASSWTSFVGSFLFILIFIRLFTFLFDKYLFHCPLEAKYLKYGNAIFLNFLEGKMKANIISFIVDLWTKQASRLVLMVKNPPANAGDIWKVGSVPGSRRSPRGRNGNPFQSSFLENLMHREGRQAI